MNLIKKKLNELKPADWNPRLIGGSELAKLKASIEEFGYLQPLIWNKRSNQLVAGHQRLKAMLLAYPQTKEIEVVEVDLDQKKEKALNIALNKISGEWDNQKLSEVLAELQTDVNLAGLTGFDPAEIQDIVNLYKTGDFKKEEFKDLIDVFEHKRGMSEKNENWFYVEFYQDEKKFKELQKLLLNNMSGKSKHEISPAFFYKAVKSYAVQK